MMKDYCTMWFDSIFGVYIGDCCKEHDIGYEYTNIRVFVFAVLVSLIVFLAYNFNWWALVLIPTIAKFSFDWQLFVCVTKKAWWMISIAVMMFSAVSLFGWIFWVSAQIKTRIKNG